MGRFFLNKWAHTMILLGLLGGIVYFGKIENEAYLRLQNLVFDAYNKFLPRERTDDVIILAIDDRSLEVLGQWPWPRSILADTVDKLVEYEAASISFDGVFAEEDRLSPKNLMKYNIKGVSLENMPDNDEIFAQSIKASKRFVVAFSHAGQAANAGTPKVKKPFLAKKEAKESFLKFAVPFHKATINLPSLEKAAKGNGSFMAYPDQDGIIRKTGMVFTDGKTLYPSLALEAIRVGRVGTKESPKIGNVPEAERKEIDTTYRLVLGDYVIPLEKDGKTRLHFRIFDENDHKDYLPAHLLFDESQKDYVHSLIKDKIVLIGAVSEGLKDLRSTPLEPFQPGVEIHANLTEQILQEHYLLRPEVAKQAELLMVIAVGMLIILLIPFMGLFSLTLLCLSLIAGAFYVGAIAFLDHKLLLDPVYPSLSIFTIFLTASMLKYIRTEAERKRVKDAFGLYISPDYMKELTGNPNKLKLGGETKELSIMFSDIRNFTTISESLTSEELIQLMNDFLTPMSDLVMYHRGTIDKYMGDAMMAFWNAPLDDEHHAYNACVAALGMQEALAPINEDIKAKAKAEGRTPVLLNAGIGINTGPCAVGNMGSKQRFAYSTLGDAVNLSSRLEGQTKQYGLNILVGEETVAQAEGLAFLEIDLIKVKGKNLPVRIFTLIGDEATADSAHFKKWKKHHDQMLAAYRNQQFAHAQDLIQLCKSDDAFDAINIDAYYDVMYARIEDLRKNRPAEDWDGVFIATTK